MATPRCTPDCCNALNTLSAMLCTAVIINIICKVRMHSFVTPPVCLMVSAELAHCCKGCVGIFAGDCRGAALFKLLHRLVSLYVLG